MNKQETLKWKWSVPVKWTAIDYSILEGYDYKIVRDTSHKVNGAPDFTPYDNEVLEIYLPCGNAKDVVRYLRNLGLSAGIEYGNGCYDKDGAYYGGGGCMKLESPLLDEFGRLKPEYEILKENNIEEFNELLKGNL